MAGERRRNTPAVVTPPFNPKAIAALYPQMAELTERALGGWRDGQVVNLWTEMKRVTRLITAKVLFGLDDPARSYAVTAASDQWLEMNFSALARLFPVAAPGTPYRRMLRLAERVEEQGRAIMRDRQQHLSSDAQDVLSLLIRAQQAGGGFLKEEELIGLVHFLFDSRY